MIALMSNLCASPSSSWCDIKGRFTLQGFRGRPAADLQALEDTLVRVSYFAMHVGGHLAELDINPLMVLPSGQGAWSKRSMS
jgi:hypothetical protein